MFTNIFGNYLIEKGLISKEQLLEVKEKQSETRVKLGLIEVKEKLLTEQQANEVISPRAHQTACQSPPKGD